MPETTTTFPADPTALIDALFAYAARERVTDLHFTPQADGGVVRARIDGHLREISRLDPQTFLKAASRLKVLAELDITERRRPQDGRISWGAEGREFDCRVSAIPTLHGESLSLRVLDRERSLLGIDQLGLPAQEAAHLRSALQHASGMTVVCGPTGAGKTTTLYAALSEVAVPERNVITIEDPIEYELPRVVQTAVQPKLGVDFATMLRSILRHDPDVIMVGEIRDPETADVAVRAALTGHLVLTSLHTERAANAVSALLNLGIKSYAVAPALRVVVAQQLIRTICGECRTRFEYGEAVLEDPDWRGLVPPGETPSFSIGMGCATCFQSGYRGRAGIFEVLAINDVLRGLILRGADAAELERAAAQCGMSSLRRNGFRAVLEGRTTVEEVARVVHIE